LAKFAAIRRASWSACWRQSGATQQHVRNRGISGSARLGLETTLMTHNVILLPSIDALRKAYSITSSAVA
jgi:hypothetical protein